MLRMFVGTFLSLLACTAAPALAQQARPEPAAAVSATSPDGKARGGPSGSKADSNREIIELLKQVIQKLEGQGKSPMPGNAFWGVEPIDMKPGAFWRVGPRDVGKESPELEKARAEVKAAEQRLQEAKAKLAKLQAAQPQPKPAPKKSDLNQRINRLIEGLGSDKFESRQEAMKELEKLGESAAPALRKILGAEQNLEIRMRTEAILKKLAKTPPVPATNAADVEQRLNRLIQEVEELRREIQKRRP